MKFEIKKFDAGGRLGILIHNGKKLTTPNLLPVVSPFENVIPPNVLYNDFKVSALFTNAYILYNNKEKARHAESIGLHSYLKYEGLIATDSGAFQHYMYGNSGDITAEEIESFQERIQSDFPVILDVPVQLSDSKETAYQKMHKTVERAKQNIQRRTSTQPAWYGPIHGTLYPEVLEHSCKAMNELDFGVYAIGGIVKAMNDYSFDVCVDAFLTVKKYLRKDKPIHMFGLGLPQFFSLAVATGADLMDSAAYILFAKEGRYFSLEGTRHISDLTELPCSCPVCTHYNAGEITALYKKDKKQKQNKGIELLARHNLHVSLGEFRTIREAIRSGSLWELVEQRIQSHPKLIRAYKKIPDYWKECEEQVPLEKKKGLLLKGSISQTRPVIRRMQEKIQRTHVIPENSVLFLIPEFQETLFNSQQGREWIHAIEMILASSEANIEPIVLSPYFGVIPLDLYGIYPFSQREWAGVQTRKSLEILDNVFDYIQNHKDHMAQIVLFHPISWTTPYNQEKPSQIHYMEELIERLGGYNSEIKGKEMRFDVIRTIEEIKNVIQ